MSTVRAKHGSMVHDFNGRQIKHHSRSSFYKLNDTTTTLVADKLIPIWRKYAYPGDTLRMEISAFVRLLTQKAPFMTPIMMDIHVWSVPIRQIWPNFLKMQGQQDKPGDSTDYLVPVINSKEGFDFGSIYDHFWQVPGVENYDTTALWYRAYTHTWNTRYRDENLQDPIEFPLDETDSIENYQLLPRGKRKDYMTSMLPWPQKGEDVLLPFSDVPVVGNGITLGLEAVSFLGGLQVNDTSDPRIYGGAYGSNIGVTTHTDVTKPVAWSTVGVTTDAEKSGLVAKMGLEGTTMSELYTANAIQQMLQLDAQGGTRYDEQILARWGVTPHNYRISAYPEFLGGGTFDLNMQIVPQTSSTNTTSPQGSLSSYGVINGTTKTIIKSFDEHCVVFAVASIRAGKYYYQYGLDRDNFKRSRTDFYEPSLANLPEQGVLKGEIFIQPKDVLNSAGEQDNLTIAGYQERWSEDKTSLSHICGYMRSNAPQPLDMWHLATDYDVTYAQLNSDFIEENLTDSLARVLALDPTYENTPPFFGQFVFNETWVKEMPVYNNAQFLMF